MKYWLIKSEPEAYSFDDLLKDKITEWSGVRNYAARNNLKAMSTGDLALFYHSVNDKELVGIARVEKEFYPDPTNDTKIEWVCVDFSPVKALNKKISLAEIKGNKAFADLELVTNSRLSVMPVKKSHWDRILKIADTTL
jgi:predicted RNA-binding protein with PUA-like domain